MTPNDEAEIIRTYLPHGAELDFIEYDGVWQISGLRRNFAANNLTDVVALALEYALNV